MKKILLSIAAVAVLFVACQQSSGTFASLEPKGFAEVADSLKNEQLIDVRTAEEFNAAHLEGATNLDWNGGQFKEEAGKLDKSKPVMLYCYSGGRSSEAADWLRKEGFSDVYEMKTGMAGWEDENLPVTAATQPNTKTADAPAEVTTAAYRTIVNSQELVLVDFGATWCGPCKMLSPRLDALEKEMPGKFKLVKLDADRDRTVADSMNITALPTLFLYKNGEVQWRNEGLVEKEVVANQIKKAEGKK